MRFNSKQYAQSLLGLAQGATKKEIPSIVEQFVQFLVRTRQWRFAHQILEQIENLVRAEEGKVKVVVESVNRIEKHTRQHILDFLRKEEGQVEFEEKIDPGVLGGVKLRLNDLLVDATLAGQLEKLRQQLL